MSRKHDKYARANGVRPKAVCRALSRARCMRDFHYVARDAGELFGDRRSIAKHYSISFYNVY